MQRFIIFLIFSAATLLVTAIPASLRSHHGKPSGGSAGSSRSSSGKSASSSEKSTSGGGLGGGAGSPKSVKAGIEGVAEKDLSSKSVIESVAEHKADNLWDELFDYPQTKEFCTKGCKFVTDKFGATETDKTPVYQIFPDPSKGCPSDCFKTLSEKVHECFFSTRLTQCISFYSCSGSLGGAFDPYNTDTHYMPGVNEAAKVARKKCGEQINCCLDGGHSGTVDPIIRPEEVEDVDIGWSELLDYKLTGKFCVKFCKELFPIPLLPFDTVNYIKQQNCPTDCSRNKKQEVHDCFKDKRQDYYEDLCGEECATYSRIEDYEKYHGGTNAKLNRVIEFANEAAKKARKKCKKKVK